MRTRRIRHRATAAALLGLAAAALAPAGLRGQADSTWVAAGPQYRARGSVHARLLGGGYRDLWRTPVRVQILDLDRFAGGLTPVEEGGHKQTRALRFRGEDGREYNFRSVDKEVTRGLPPWLRETTIDWVLQDQVSAQHPAAPTVATALLDAVGVLNPGPRLVVMPDDARLGGFRAEFAGLLGTIELHANEAEGDGPGFAGAPRVAGTDRVLEHLREDPDHRVDSRAFLRARLMDVLIGDWDRHADQWRWARYDADGLHRWVPVPEDRDYAFVNHDGLLARLARRSVLPRLVRFQERYPDLLAMMDNSLDLNRRLLADLERAAWDSVAVRLQARLDDALIEQALLRMPPEYHRQAGAELARRLRARRDRLRAMAAEYYALMAENVEVHGTDQPDRAEIVRTADGAVRVSVYRRDQGHPEPYFRRLFRPEETREVRLFLHGGDDRATIEGEGGPITLRVVGGEGDDHLEERSRGRSVFYDADGDNRFLPGARTRVVRAAERRPPEGDTLLPGAARDWGETRSPFRPWIGWRPHPELLLGGGPSWTRYAYRHHPFASRVHLRALYAPLHGRAGLVAAGDFRRENSAGRLEVRAEASNLEAVRFHGLGNESPGLPVGEARVWQNRLSLTGLWHTPLSPAAEVAWGGSAIYRRPSHPPGTPIAVRDGYGSEPFGQLGAEARLRVDTRDSETFPRHGVRLEMGAVVHPAVAGVVEPFGRLRAEAAAYAALPRGSVLALRAGGDRVAGRFPYQEAAFLGGSGTLRGYRFQRFAGDAAVYGGAELRVPLREMEILARGTLGVMLLGDAGRVFVDGASPGSWHAGLGGGVWFALPVGAASVSYARGEEDRVYVHFGLPF